LKAKTGRYLQDHLHLCYALIKILLPLKIDASVTMIQVEKKSDVTYYDLGDCKKQIEKLHEVIETPLLLVSGVPRYPSLHSKRLSQNDL
jgi:ATP-dependent 26S proteasome regulatory subunit